MVLLRAVRFQIGEKFDSWVTRKPNHCNQLKSYKPKLKGTMHWLTARNVTSRAPKKFSPFVTALETHRPVAGGPRLVAGSGLLPRPQGVAPQGGVAGPDLLERAPRQWEGPWCSVGKEGKNLGVLEETTKINVIGSVPHPLLSTSKQCVSAKFGAHFRGNQ